MPAEPELTGDEIASFVSIYGDVIDTIFTHKYEHGGMAFMRIEVRYESPVQLDNATVGDDSRLYLNRPARILAQCEPGLVDEDDG